MGHGQHFVVTSSLWFSPGYSGYRHKEGVSSVYSCSAEEQVPATAVPLSGNAMSDEGVFLLTLPVILQVRPTVEHFVWLSTIKVHGVPLKLLLMSNSHGRGRVFSETAGFWCNSTFEIPQY